MVWTAEISSSEFTNYAQLFSSQWMSRHRASTLWIEAYRVIHLPGSDTPDPPRSVDLGDVCATFVRGVLEYQSVRAPVLDLATPETWLESHRHPPQMQIPIFMEEWVPKVDSDSEPSSLSGDSGQVPATAEGGILLLHNMQIVNHRTNLGTFVIMATPHKREGQRTDETAARQRLKATAGLLGAVLGRNAVFEPVFDVEIGLSGQAAGIITPTFENPAAFRDPNLSDAGLGMLELCAARISALPTDVQRRTQLSLHLLYQAMREMDGVFAFLALHRNL